MTFLHSESDYKELLAEFQATKRKLDSKIEAILLVSQELASCQSFKDSILQENDFLKRRCNDFERALSHQKEEKKRNASVNEEQQQNLMQMVRCLKQDNRDLLEENERLKLKFSETDGDVKLLRKQLAQHQLLALEQQMSFDAEHDSTFGDAVIPQQQISHSDKTATNDDMLSKLEHMTEQYYQIERDLKSLLCEKEELVIERDAYQTKSERLNQELKYILNGDDRQGITDIDSLIMENRYLKEQLKHAQEENSLAKQAIMKYKNLLDKRKKILKSAAISQQPTTMSGVSDSQLVTVKQIQSILQKNSSDIDYRVLSQTLMDAVNDKTLALSHQRKANKILGTRVSELEAKVKQMEINMCRSPGRSIISSASQSGQSSPSIFSESSTQTETPAEDIFLLSSDSANDEYLFRLMSSSSLQSCENGDMDETAIVAVIQLEEDDEVGSSNCCADDDDQTSRDVVEQLIAAVAGDYRYHLTDDRVINGTF